jgi:hypothetical protein
MNRKGLTRDMTNRSLIRTKIEDAKHQLVIAESGLEEAVLELREMARADKTCIGEAAEHAFETLREARQHLARLELLLESGDDDA